MEKYFVPKIDTPLEGVVTVPGSKSMTNRALLLATLSEEESVLSFTEVSGMTVKTGDD